MISGKCFISWFKEAGRGHLTAFVGWGVFLIYGILLVMGLSFDTDRTFFGIGNIALLWICAGLGLVFSFLEFFYLLQRKKQDFYFSLPVSRGIIFWSRYVHGLVHFLSPLILALSVCGIYQTSVDFLAAPHMAGYTGKSILVFGAVFLIFYHIGILCIAVCGNPVSAVFMCLVFFSYGQILVENVITVLAENYFYTYYRIPLLEKLIHVLSPLDLSISLNLAGELYDKNYVLSHTPPVEAVIPAIAWIVFTFLLFTAAQRFRKVEKTGRAFMLAPAERGTEIVLAFLAGTWAFAFLSDVTGLAGTSRISAAAVSVPGAAAAALAVHCLLEGIVKNPGTKLFRRKWQMMIPAAAAVLTGCAFAAGAGSYDRYFPEQVSAVGISIDGLGMNYNMYTQALSGERYVTDHQLEEYVLREDGRAAALGWLREVVEQNDGDLTRVTVCYENGRGQKIYRVYPVSRDTLEAFASVYDTEEYKEIAYPVGDLGDVSEDRFSWNNGISTEILKLTAEEKKAVLEAYTEDVADLSMEDLPEVLPRGSVDIESSRYGDVTVLEVYPFFERTCSYLEKLGVDIQRQISDYEVDSVEVTESSPVPAGTVGGVRKSFYDKPEEIQQWKNRLVPEDLDIQPLLCPLEHKDVRADVLMEESNSVHTVECALLPGVGR